MSGARQCSIHLSGWYRSTRIGRDGKHREQVRIGKNHGETRRSSLTECSWQWQRLHFEMHAINFTILSFPASLCMRSLLLMCVCSETSTSIRSTIHLYKHPDSAPTPSTLRTARLQVPRHTNPPSSPAARVHPHPPETHPPPSQRSAHPADPATSLPKLGISAVDTQSCSRLLPPHP